MHKKLRKIFIPLLYIKNLLSLDNSREDKKFYLSRNVRRFWYLFLFFLLVFLLPALGFSDALTGVTAVPADAKAGANSSYTVNFTTSATGWIPIDGKILITFPAGFDISGISFVSSSTIGGGFTIGIAGQTVTFTRDGTGGVIGSGIAVGISFANVVNNTTAGTTYTVDVEIQDNTSATIDGPTPSANFTITPGDLAYFTVAGEPASTTAGQDLTSIGEYNGNCV